MKKALIITASVLVLLAVSWKVGTEVFDRKAPCFSVAASGDGLMPFPGCGKDR